MTEQGDSAPPKGMTEQVTIDNTRQNQDLGPAITELEDMHGQKDTNTKSTFLASKLFPSSSEASSSSSSPPERIMNCKDSEVRSQGFQVLNQPDSQSDQIGTGQVENKEYEVNGQWTPNRSPSSPSATSLSENRNPSVSTGFSHSTAQGMSHSYNTETQSDNSVSPNVPSSINQNINNNASNSINQDGTYSRIFSNNGSFSSSFQTSPNLNNSNLTKNIPDINEGANPTSSPPLFVASQKNKVMRSPRK